MSEQVTTTQDDIKQALGFDPFAQGDSVYACAMIEHGRRAGFWCVFTQATQLDADLVDHPNFVDTTWGAFGDTPERSGLIYTYSPIAATTMARYAG